VTRTSYIGGDDVHLVLDQHP